MSIIVKGMAMPKYCRQCFFFASGCPCNKYKKGRPSNCPLVEIPPHGRLIDADAYESLLRGLGDRNYRREKGTICDAVKFLHPHYAPTIIEAEEGET